MSERYDAAEVKRRLRFLDLLAHEGIAVRRSAGLWLSLCPFHAEDSGSFTTYDYEDHERDHAHCYGCGWNGDIYKFWMERRGGGFVEALRALASLASVAPGVFEAKRQQASQVTRMTTAPRDNTSKPALPRMRALNEAEIVRLAALRGLDAAGVRAAAHVKRVGACDWPQFIDRDGCWRVAKDAGVCWVVTDAERSVAQFRRLDGEQFVRKDQKKIKAWTKGSPTWPLGAGEMGERAAVLIVEGGADMLAAFHFLAKFHRLERVAVCSMLGASMRIAETALPHFARRRVRIVMDEDEPKDDRGIRPGCEAAARWTAQLAEAGAAVETFSLAGLMTKTGAKVKDLNDLAFVDEAAWLDGELRAAFFDFDF